MARYVAHTDRVVRIGYCQNCFTRRGLFKAHIVPDLTRSVFIDEPPKLNSSVDICRVCIENISETKHIVESQRY
jgi:hypothetical protein